MAPVPLMTSLDQGLEVESKHLDAIQQKLKDKQCTHVCIVSVMGAWRTGKSFLLDLLLRYLRSRAAREAEMENAPELSGPPDGDNESEWVFENSRKDPPQWIFQGGDFLTEGGGLDGGDSQGFGWKGGKDRCTTGIWIFNEPFALLDKDKRRIGVVLMDTQGAWDSKITREQSATIFGMTSLLSSKLIYNISGRIDADKLANLDYFTTCAEKACGIIRSDKTPFGQLEFLIRDWQNYEAGNTMDECKQQMNDHMGDFFHGEEQAEKERSARLKKCFSSIGCFGLPHPSLKVARTQYDGDLKVIDHDFFHLLNGFVEQLFGDESSFPRPSAPAGEPLTTQNFAKTVSNFAKVFAANQEMMTLNLREAFVEIRADKDEEKIISEFRNWLKEVCPDYAVVDPEQLKHDLDERKDIHRKDFQNKLAPFKLEPEQEQAYVQELLAKLDEASEARIVRNQKEVEAATLKVVGAPVVGFGVYFAASHAWLLAMGGAIGGWFSMKKHAARNHTEMVSSAVFSGIAEDSVSFVKNRYKDLQAMGVAVQRLEINKVTEQVMGAGARGMAIMNASNAIEDSPGALELQRPLLNQR